MIEMNACDRELDSCCLLTKYVMSKIKSSLTSLEKKKRVETRESKICSWDEIM
jgi:hypothetical protein